MDIAGAHLGWKMLWKGGAGPLGRFVFLFTLMQAPSFSPTSEFEPVKSPYGVGRYCEMAVFLTRSHLLWLIRLLYVHSGSFFIHFVKCVMSFDKRYLHSQFILVSSFQDGFRPDKRKNFLWFVGYFFNWQLINCNVWHFYYYFARK